MIETRRSRGFQTLLLQTSIEHVSGMGTVAENGAERDRKSDEREQEVARERERSGGRVTEKGISGERKFLLLPLRSHAL